MGNPVTTLIYVLTYLYLHNDMRHNLQVFGNCEIKCDLHLLQNISTRLTRDLKYEFHTTMTCLLETYIC